jgi:hydroxymethylpyrimidine pyrophosphatase-like HAD family hydrolase
MYFIALATDYDGTIAEDGVVADATLEALHELKQSGRKLLLVTGRQLPDLRNVLPEIALFDLIVAENGGLLFDPKTGEETLLSPQPPQLFLDVLRARGVPVSAGRCIVATWEPHQHAVLEAIRELGLELQIIFNKGAVMVLPAGVSKASVSKRRWPCWNYRHTTWSGLEMPRTIMLSFGFAAALWRSQTPYRC